MATDRTVPDKGGETLGKRFPRFFDVADQLLRPVEFLVKKPVFGCHMCGQCILHSNGLTCPMECPKKLRNGPCGGVGMDGRCEVDHSRTCRWYLALDRAARLPWWREHVHQIQHAVDWALEGTSSWVNLIAGRDHRELASPPWQEIPLPDRADKPIRCGSRLERLLRAGQFAITADVGAPVTADGSRFVERMKELQGIVDLIEIGDNGGALAKTNCVAAAALLERQGIETMIHLTCRDRNRLALQADVLGAQVLGIRNLLCLTGDHPSVGDHPQARPVFDLDSLTFIKIVRQMRDEGVFESGRAMEVAPRILIGGAISPTAPPLDFRPQRLAKKIAAGADFVVSQQVFDMDLLARFMQRVCDLGLDKKVYILIGVGAVSGPEMARATMQKVPGVVIPEHVIRRLESVPEERRKAEGIKICVEQILQLKEMRGISGIALMINSMPGLREPFAPLTEIVEGAGLMPRPVLPDQ